MDPISNLAMAAGLSWASGIRLYATILVVGLLGKFSVIPLPDSLQVLSNVWVLGVSGFLMVIEFVADKIAWVDTAWDSIHTFIRIPAGALLAVGAIGSDDAVVSTVVALLGGTLVGATHATKAGARMLVNTSPEPVSNVVTSVAEDAIWLSGGIMALVFPMAFLVVLALFLIALLWFSPKLYRLFKPS